MTNVTNLDAWKKDLETDSQGGYKANVATITDVLKAAPDLKDKLGYDEFAQAPYVLGALPWDKREDPRPLEDVDVVKFQVWLQRNEINARVKNTVLDAVLAVASEKPYHPVRDYLNALEWDGIPRVDTWLVNYLGAEVTAYVKAVGRKTLIAAVARVEKPGCKVDTMLVLEGGQGIGKSRALQVLAGPWVLEELSDMQSKDGKLEMQGNWIVEVSELHAMKRTEVETIKAFLSKQVDTFRPPYGRFAKNHPRQCVLVGTTNSETYLRDHTGNRRFWPVRCGQINLEALSRDRDQIWAEACTAYNDGESWWLSGNEVELASEQQRQRFENDVWQAPIEAYLDKCKKPMVTMLDIIEECLNLPRNQQNPVTGRRVSQIMSQTGWEGQEQRVNRKDKLGKNRKVFVWCNPTQPDLAPP